MHDAKAGKNRLHLDLRAEGVTTSDELARLRVLGATPANASWVVPADPEGNELCLLSRSVQEL